MFRDNFYLCVLSMYTITVYGKIFYHACAEVLLKLNCNDVRLLVYEVYIFLTGAATYESAVLCGSAVPWRIENMVALAKMYALFLISAKNTNLSTRQNSARSIALFAFTN